MSKDWQELALLSLDLDDSGGIVWTVGTAYT